MFQKLWSDECINFHTCSLEYVVPSCNHSDPALPIVTSLPFEKKKNCCFINERVGAILIPWVQFVISLSNYHTSNGVLLWKLFLHCAHCSTDIFQYFEWKKRNLEWDWRCHVCALLWRGGRSWVLGILWTKYVGVNTRFLLRFSFSNSLSHNLSQEDYRQLSNIQVNFSERTMNFFLMLPYKYPLATFIYVRTTFSDVFVSLVDFVWKRCKLNTFSVK